MEIGGLWTNLLKTGDSVIQNSLPGLQDAAGIQESSLSPRNLLAVPLRQQDKIVGLMALLNKESSYNVADRMMSESLASAFVETLMPTHRVPIGRSQGSRRGGESGQTRVSGQYEP